MNKELTIQELIDVIDNANCLDCGTKTLITKFLKENSDLKEYYILLSIDGISDNAKYLNFDSNLNEFYFSDSENGYITKTKFTEEEIKTLLPKSIQDAIADEFLKLEEA